jgi:tetratricopeptide repeat protein
MHNKLILLFSASSILFLSSCSKLGALSSNNFTVVPNPLETQAGKVDATITAVFPEKYMKRKAVVTVVPELRYGKGLVSTGVKNTFQGEKVKGNHQQVSYRLGGRYTLKTSFNYVPEMQQSDLYLAFEARKGKKVVKIPAVKVANGIIATSELYKQVIFVDGGCLAPDSFQRVREEKQEAGIKFLVNQANLRKSELQNNSIQEFVRMLKRINQDRERLNLRNVEVKAYASPEGGFAFNDKLANKRQTTGETYVKGQLKANKISTGIDAGYTAQDWDGFQRLVQASNIQDKDVILRVLSMYKDPQERETQIRNMSEGFRELAFAILPELRRARLIINYETIGRSDDEITAQYKQDASKLTADELLYLATLVDDNEQAKVYETTAKLYDKDYRAYNNLATLAIKKGDKETALRYLEQALRIDSNASEALANMGLLYLSEGNIEEAERNIARSANANTTQYAVGALALAKGNYADAEKTLAEKESNLAALAQILNKNYAEAGKTLDAISSPSALTLYLHAISSARRGNKFAASSFLQDALSKDPSLKNYADKDLELSLVK